MRLEDYLAAVDQKIAAGEDPPEGKDWGGLGIVTDPLGHRWAYRDYCELEEVPTAEDPPKYGIYVHAHAPNASRFRSSPG